VRSLGLESSFYLTTGTFNQIVKDRFRLPPERFVLDLTDRLNAGLSSKPVASLRRQALETNLLTVARFAAARQPGISTLLTFSILGLHLVAQTLLSVLRKPRSKIRSPRLSARLTVTSFPARSRKREGSIQFNKDQFWRFFENPSGTRSSRILPRRICLGGSLVAYP
jgi:hypothetical protein